ncbi:MAG: peptidylprolyl isomerase [Betaproteobacteria bacterium RIFCSPLOWO2_02_FULL_67_26]|nr:MAG: peptidylprolyl isomerase [Betaproteobacteria bacterium RIFCSPLOWO2_02_FULL_67_26]
MKSCTLFLAGLLLATAAHAQNGVARVNGVTIPQQRMDLFIKDLSSQGRADSPELRNAVKQELIDRELLAQEAARRGLHKKPEVAAQIDLARQSVLVRAVLSDAARSAPVSEDAIKKEYERIKGQLGSREYKARHILVENEDEAKDIISQIKGGGSFEKLAADRSKDQGTKVRGGELDWSAPSGYVKPFGDALTRLKKGQMTETPVQTNFGWHVIRLDDERALKVPPYDQVKPNLQQQMQQQQQKLSYQKIISDLRAKAKIE